VCIAKRLIACYLTLSLASLTCIFVLKSLAEWYRGVILSASADRVEWEVEFHDGDVDSTICRKCVRPYLPYTLDEEVDWRSEENIFYRGRVVGGGPNEYDEEMYDILIDEFDEVLQDVSPVDMRRFETLAPFENLAELDAILNVGTRVVVMYQGNEDEWYPGVITKRNKEGTFQINYDDGDVELRVPIEFLSLEE
jgi:hypothetical protein